MAKKIRVTITATTSDQTQKVAVQQRQRARRRKGWFDMTLPWNLAFQTTFQYVTLSESHWRNWGQGETHTNGKQANISQTHVHKMFDNFMAKGFLNTICFQLQLTFNAYLAVLSVLCIYCNNCEFFSPVYILHTRESSPNKCTWFAHREKFDKTPILLGWSLGVQIISPLIGQNEVLSKLNSTLGFHFWPDCGSLPLQIHVKVGSKLLHDYA